MRRNSRRVNGLVTPDGNCGLNQYAYSPDDYNSDNSHDSFASNISDSQLKITN